VSFTAERGPSRSEQERRGFSRNSLAFPSRSSTALCSSAPGSHDLT